MKSGAEPGTRLGTETGAKSGTNGMSGLRTGHGGTEIGCHSPGQGGYATVTRRYYCRDAETLPPRRGDITTTLAWRRYQRGGHIPVEAWPPPATGRGRGPPETSSRAAGTPETVGGAGVSGANGVRHGSMAFPSRLRLKDHCFVEPGFGISDEV